MRALACLFVLACAAAAPAAAQRVMLVDRIVAVVNREVITASELAERVAYAERELRRQGTGVPERAQLERQVLERLILDRAQAQEARELGIRVEDAQLDRTIERIAEGNMLTLAAFRQALERDGVPFARFREEVRREILIGRLREREVEERIFIGDSEIDLFIEEARAAGAASVEYNLQHVLVRLPEQASPERIAQARARAEQVVREARAGGDFARLAASFSDAPDGLQGGGMGWRSRDRLPEIFSAALARMRPGEVSEALRSPAGFHVLRLVEVRGGGPLAAQRVNQTRARHILVRTSEIVSETDARRRLADLRERILTGKQDFADLARVHSQDGTAARGGDLDWLYPGDTVPEFERAMDALAPGEVSLPVRSPFGFHLIQVLERRVGEVSLERQRQAARLALRERRSDEAYQDWLRQLRDRVYVELRLEDR